MDLILDTNIFVAAGFNPRSSSAQIVQLIRSGKHTHTWNQHTLNETSHIINQIPPLNWSKFTDLFPKTTQYTGPVQTQSFIIIEDPDDRKFAALSQATRAIIITNDHHLLDHRSKLDISIQTPSEFLKLSD